MVSEVRAGREGLNPLRPAQCIKYYAFIVMMNSCIMSTIREYIPQPRKVGIMLECSTVELPVRTVFMHHDTKGHKAFKHYAALTG